VRLIRPRWRRCSSSTTSHPATLRIHSKAGWELKAGACMTKSIKIWFVFLSLSTSATIILGCAAQRPPASPLPSGGTEIAHIATPIATSTGNPTPTVVVPGACLARNLAPIDLASYVPLVHHLREAMLTGEDSKFSDLRRINYGSEDVLM